MDASLKQICQALKAVFSILKPHVRPVSFVLLVGRVHQGKTALLKQSGLKLYPSPVASVNILYHDEGVMLELCETYLSEVSCLLSTILKQFNRVHPAVRISGLILCMDVQLFMDAEVDEVLAQAVKHVQLLKRFVNALAYAVEVSLFFTKSDVLAGLIPFFQATPFETVGQPLGFSIDAQLALPVAIKQYRQRYDQLIRSLMRDVLPKLQAVRSSAQRTLIREFPLQLASLKASIQGVVEALLKEGVLLKGLYWMSAESRTHHVDRIHQRILHDYDIGSPVQSSEFRPQPAYFVRGALETVFNYTKQHARHLPPIWQWTLGGMVGVFCFLMAMVLYGSLQTASLLDHTSQELLAYDLLVKSGQKPTAAAYHLTQALKSLQSIPYPMERNQTVRQLQTLLRTHSAQSIQHRFLPQLLQTLALQMHSTHVTQQERYEALKTYLRLVEPQHFSAPLIRTWFKHHWAQYPPQSPEKARDLLEEVLIHPVKEVEANRQLIQETRNYLNALPAGYFYYLLAKKSLPTQQTPLHFSGLILSHQSLPLIYTKAAFSQTMQQLEQIAAQLREENWVLERADLDELPLLLQQAYCFEYVTFWKQFMKQIHFAGIHDFQSGQRLAATLTKDKSMMKVIELVQAETKPYLSVSGQLVIFNEKIASQFTTLHFLSQRSVYELTQAIQELEGFLATLSVVHDDGQTVFSFTKARFQDDNTSDALGLLYQRIHTLPPPIADWVKQLADAIWLMLIQQSRQYLNARWETTVYPFYEKKLANRFPFDMNQTQEVNLSDFEAFFSPKGMLAQFMIAYMNPFLDRSHAQWKAKTRNGLMMPISEDMMNEMIRANVISNMFFSQGNHGEVVFNLEKVTLDPVVSRLQLTVGKTMLEDNQSSHTNVSFHWPDEGASLKIDSIEGGHYTLEEQGVWAFFKMLQKVNVLVDADDPSTLQILFEINGNAGRYVLKTQNQINPFSPGILDGFILNKALV